jgi:GT2 family glycosyltransferase
MGVTAPSIAVVIPTHRRPLDLARCLHAIGRNLAPGDPLQVVVVDDGSDCGYTGVLDTIDFPVCYFRQEQRGPAAARNAGLRLTATDVVAFLDDDCAPSSTWLRELRTALIAEPDVAGIGGDVQPMYPESKVASFVQAAHVLRHDRHPVYGWQLVTCNAAYRREALEVVGGFDERYAYAGGEDYDLSRRLWAAGYTLGVTDSATVYHHHAMTLRELVRTGHRYGGASFRLDQLDRELLPKQERQAAPNVATPSASPPPLDDRTIVERFVDLGRLVRGQIQRRLLGRRSLVSRASMRLAHATDSPLYLRADTERRIPRAARWVIIGAWQCRYVGTRYRRFHRDGARRFDAIVYAGLGTVYETAFWVPRGVRGFIVANIEGFS